MQTLKIVIDLLLILYGLIFMIWPKKIFKIFWRSDQSKKDPKIINKIRIWGIVFFIIGILILIWLLLS